MQDFLYIEMNGFSMIILLIVFLNIRNMHGKYFTEQKLFNIILILNVLILLADSIDWILNGTKDPTLRIILLLFETIYYLLHSVICMVWSIYIDFQINRNLSRIFRLLFPLLIPVLISSVLSVLSAFGNYLFYFDKYYVYHRGQYFFLLPVLCGIYLFYSGTFVLRNRQRIQKPFFRSFLLLCVPPIIGMVFQFSHYGIPLIWTGMTLSILIIFISIQNDQMYKDYLTGLFNRRQLDIYLQEIIQKSKNNVAGIMLDMNSFKNINDCYGHSSGDEALKIASNLLIKTFYPNGFISRFGGDEFVVLLEIHDRLDLNRILLEFKKNVRDFNLERELPYNINFSIGADIYSQGSKMTGKDFLNHIDSLMYKDKTSTSYSK